MSEAMGQNNKLSNDKKAGPTRSFDHSTPGPGSQIDHYRWLLDDGPDNTASIQGYP